MDGYIGTEIFDVNEKGICVWAIAFTVHKSSTYFHEHFVSFHLLPAVAEIDIVVKSARKLSGKCIDVISIAKTKFAKPIQPDIHLVLNIDMHIDGIISFTYKGIDGSLYSAGKIGYRS